MIILSTNFLQTPWIILIGIILFFAIIALIVFLLRKKLKLSKLEKPKDDHKVAEENLSHYLEDVDDPETQKQFDEFEKKQKEKQTDDNKKESK